MGKSTEAPHDGAPVVGRGGARGEREQLMDGGVRFLFGSLFGSGGSVGMRDYLPNAKRSLL